MTGRAGSAKGSEPIYRRCDVHIVRSADKWYRMGREVKVSFSTLEFTKKLLMPMIAGRAAPETHCGAPKATAHD